jgi:WD40 repeat protein
VELVDKEKLKLKFHHHRRSIFAARFRCTLRKENQGDSGDEEIYTIMKIKTISRSSADYVRERVSGVEKLQKNKDPRIHPFEQAREYTRAVRAVKLDKMFAKPFIGAMDDHSDGVWCTATSPTRVTQFVSGSCDGEIRVWDLALRRTVWASYAHTGFVRGLTVDRTGKWLFSCGDDRTIKQFRFDPERGSGRHDLHTEGGGGTGQQSGSLKLTGRDQAPEETWMSKSGM